MPVFRLLSPTCFILTLLVRYTPSSGAVGVIAAATVGGAAKLSDSNINYLFTVATGPLVFRLDSSVAPTAYRYAYIKTTAHYTDTAEACGLTAVPAYVCQTTSFSACPFYYDSSFVYSNIGGTTTGLGGRLDTLDDHMFNGGTILPNDAHRIFFDYYGAQQCFGSTGTVSKKLRAQVIRLLKKER